MESDLKARVLKILDDFFLSEQGNRLTRYNMQTLVVEISRQFKDETEGV